MRSQHCFEYRGRDGKITGMAFDAGRGHSGPFVTKNGSHIVAADWSRFAAAALDARNGTRWIVPREDLEKLMLAMKAKGLSDEECARVKELAGIEDGSEYDRMDEINKRHASDSPVGDAMMAHIRGLADHGDFGRSPPSPPRSSFADRGMALDEKAKKEVHELVPGLARITRAD